MASNTTEWLSRLRERNAALPSEVDPAEAATAVMCVLVERLTAGEAHELFESMPPSMRALFRSCEAHRERKPVHKFDRAELIMRVARHLGVTPAHGEAITTAVLAAIRKELPSKVVEHVASQLPRDLKNLWLASGAVAPPSSPVLESGARHIVEEEIARRLPRGSTSPAAALGCVMGHFLQRISGGEAWDVFMGLPEELHPLLEGAALDRAEAAHVFGRKELLADIAHDLRIPYGEAETVARAVFAAVRQVLPTKEIDDVASELPDELRALWLDTA